MNESSEGFLEKLSWKAIFAAIVTFFTLFIGFPEYIFNLRPQIENALGVNTLSFIEGAIAGSVTTIIVLKLLAERRKKLQNLETKKE